MRIPQIFETKFGSEPERDDSIEGGNPDGNKKIINAEFFGEKHAATNGDDADRTLSISWMNERHESIITDNLLILRSVVFILLTIKESVTTLRSI